MSVIIGVRVAKKRKTTSTKSSTSTSSSSTSSKPNTTQTTQTTTNNCNCESRLSTLEQKINNINSCTCDKNKITTLENLIANLQTQFNNLSNNQNVIDSNIETIRLYPYAYLNTEENGSFILLNEQSIVYDLLISESNYTDEEIYNALKYRDTYIKDSIYASYFTVNNKKVNVSKNILNEVDLDGSILPLPIIVDLPNLNDTNNYPDGLLFNFSANETTKTINNIKFEIDRYYDGNTDYIGKVNIKITYPETIQILTNIDNKFISSKTGKIITITNVIVNGVQKEHLKDNTSLENVYKLVAQGATKTYEIIIDWYKTYIPEYN